MRKFLVILFIVFSLSILFAELVVDIPFNLNIVGQSFAANGSYVYTSDWITISNTGADSLTYTFLYSYENLPANWYLSICDTANCFMPDWPVPIGLAAGASKQIHISVTVVSIGGFTFNFTFSGGDLTESLIYNFTFNTEDNVSADNALIIPEKLSQNYPNPFNPSGAGHCPFTTISYDLIDQKTDVVVIQIYNIKGQLIKTFTNLTVSNNSGSVIWDGKDKNGKTVESGIYLYRLKGMGSPITRKMVLIK